MASGTYIPILTNTANISSSTAFECQYMMVENVVTVSGSVNITPTADNTETRLNMSLPISSYLTQEQCAGTAIAGEAFGASPHNGGMILGSPPTNTAVLIFTSNVTVSHTFVFTFTYLIVEDIAPVLTVSGGIATASYTPLGTERNKPPYITDVVIAGPFQSGSILTATIEGGVNGPFPPGVHQYQWYRASVAMGPTLVAIPGATSNQYTVQVEDEDYYLICAARFVQVGGGNNMSPWFYSEMTDLIVTGGDINVAWADFFDIESGASVPSNWNNAGVNPSLINLSSNAENPDWTTVDATKPAFSVDKLVFANQHKVTGVATNHPPIFEMWIKGRFTASNGAMVGWGSQTLFGMNASGQYVITGMPPQAGDFNEHVFRIVLNGDTSIFQVDGGAEVTFDEAFTSATTLALGQTFSGANPGDCEIKRLQRTAHGSILTTQQVADKWAYHGF